MPKICVICKDIAHGFHFGVMSCRACGAFFRRAITTKFKRKCCKFDNNCIQRNGSKYPYCKPCRLKYCLQMGMNPKYIQRPGKSVEKFVGRPTVVLFANRTNFKNRHFVNVYHLVAKASEILELGAPSPYGSTWSQLEKLSMGGFTLPRKLRKLNFVGEKDAYDIWKFDFLTAAKWLTHFDEFNKLESKLKMKLLQATWHVFSRLQRVLRTSELWRVHNKSMDMAHLCQDIYVHKENTEFDVSWYSRYPFEEVRGFLHGIGNECQADNLRNVVTKHHLSEVELTFMSAQLCFQYAENRFAGTNLAETCEKFQSVLACDLHNYYLKTFTKGKNYAGRLAVMMRTNQGIQKSIRQIRERSLIAKTFDIFLLDYSHLEMFIDLGY